MSILKDLAIRANMEDYEKARNECLSLYEQGRKLLDLADERSRQVIQYGAFECNAVPSNRIGEVTAQVDRAFWRSAFRFTGLGALLDAEAKKSFERSLRDKCPAFSVDNVRAMALQLYQKKDELRMRGVYNIFRRLSESYKTNEKHAFEVKEKLILRNLFDTWYTEQGKFRISTYMTDPINDLDRSICQLMGTPYVERGLETRIHSDFCENGFFEDSLLKLKGFKNGNGHLWIKDKTLLERINNSIVEYVGAAIPDGRRTH